MKKAVARRRLVLNFHGIGPMPSHVLSDETFYWCEDLRVFDCILDAIPDVSARSGTPIEITFDDGNASDFTCALPALARRGLVASFFVCAGRIGQASYLDKGAMTEMVAAGMMIGSHGWSHIDWRNADRQTLTKETEDAKHTIEDTIGKRVDSVAIPFGSYNRRVIDSLKIFSKVYTSDGGLAPPLSRFIPRFSYNKTWSETRLSELASQREGLLATLKRSVASMIKGRSHYRSFPNNYDQQRKGGLDLCNISPPCREIPPPEPFDWPRRVDEQSDEAPFQYFQCNSPTVVDEVAEPLALDELGYGYAGPESTRQKHDCG